MNTITKILGAALLIGGGIYASRFMRTSDTAKKLSVSITGASPPKVVKGAVVLSVNVSFDNPTSHTMSLKKPYLIARYNGSEAGNSIPSDERINIKANDRTIIKGINIQIPFLKLGLFALNLVTGKLPKMAFEIEMQTEADGIPYSDKKQFNL
jgi:hypothetical protein